MFRRRLTFSAALLVVAAAACDVSVDDESSTRSSPAASASTGQGSVTDDPVNGLADDASEAADVVDSAPLLRIRNATSQELVLTSEGERTTVTVAAGESVRLMTERVCRWIPLTATTVGGRFVDAFTEPCQGQTWIITEN